MGIEIEPSGVHVLPSEDICAVKVLPERASDTQTGAAPETADAMPAPPAVDVRYWRSTPFDGVVTAIAKAESGNRLSRIMTPAFAQSSEWVSDSTHAVIVPSPRRG